MSAAKILKNYATVLDMIGFGTPARSNQVLSCSSKLLSVSYPYMARLRDAAWRTGHSEDVGILDEWLSLYQKCMRKTPPE